MYALLKMHEDKILGDMLKSGQISQDYLESYKDIVEEIIEINSKYTSKGWATKTQAKKKIIAEYNFWRRK